VCIGVQGGSIGCRGAQGGSIACRGAQGGYLYTSLRSLRGNKNADAQCDCCWRDLTSYSPALVSICSACGRGTESGVSWLIMYVKRIGNMERAGHSYYCWNSPTRVDYY